jgi:hypothetical protein
MRAEDERPTQADRADGNRKKRSSAAHRQTFAGLACQNESSRPVIYMSRKHRVTLAVVILGSTTMSQTPSMAQLKTQTAFDLESPMTRMVRVPPAVLHQLAAHHDVREFLDGRSGSEAEVLSAFEAAPAHINTDGEEDLVVRNSRLNGANIGPFWLFTRTAQGYKLVFFTRSLGVSILRPVAAGYHDLKVSSATAVTLSQTRYRFDGKAYKPKECTRTDLSTERTVRVPCSDAR